MHMENDPWKNVFEELDNPTHINGLKDDLEPLTILNAIRKHSGEPYKEGLPDPIDKVTLQGEQIEDDTEFKLAIAEAIRDTLDHSPEILYNPGSGMHVSLAKVFEGSRTIFSDVDGDVEHAFIQHNLDQPDDAFEFYRADMHSFKLPDGIAADVTLILNAGYMTEEELNDVVAENGIVIVNDWHSAATYMSENCPSYKLVKKVEYTDDSNNLFVFKKKATE